MSEMSPFGFADFAETDPDRRAIIGPGEARRSAGQVLANVGRIRRWVAESLHGDRSRIALITDNDSSVIELYLACITGGSSLLIASADAPSHELLAQLRQYEPNLVIVNAAPQKAQRLPDLAPAGPARRVVSLAGADGGQARLDRAVASYSSEQLDAVPGELFVTTSGTTGEAKVVGFPMRDILMGAPINSLPIPEEYNVFDGPHLTWGQMHGGPVHLMATIIVLNIGRPVVLSDDSSPESILNVIEEHAVTSAVLMPWNMQQLVSLPSHVRERYDISSLRAIFHGGAPCPRWLKQRMLDWVGPVLLETYATTETGPVTEISSADWLARPGSVGQAVEGAAIRVVNEHGADCEPGEVGSVLVRTQHHQAWHDPGDLGSLDEDGWLALAGRQADVLTRGTRNVYPDEIEHALSSCRGVAELAAVGFSGPDDIEDEIFVVVSRNGEATDAEIVDELRQQSQHGLSPMKQPAKLLFVEELPRGRDGKVLRRVLREIIAGQGADGQLVELAADSPPTTARA